MEARSRLDNRSFLAGIAYTSASREPVLTSAGISANDFAFVQKCAKPPSMSSNSATPPRAPSPKSPAAPEVPPPAAPRPRRKRRVILWTLLAILVAGVVWVSIGVGLVPLGVRELFGFKPDRIIVDASFSVGPHTFRYYKFSLPEGSANVAVVGQFKSAAQVPVAGIQSPAGDNAANESGDVNKDQNREAELDNSIEAYVLTEPAFKVWQKGSAPSSLYDSGYVAESALQADIPAGAGIYYLVFSNKSAPKTPKAVHATVALHYKSWLRRAFTHNGIK